MQQIIQTVKKTVTARTTAPVSLKPGALLRRGSLPRSSCGLSLRRDCNGGPWEISRALAWVRPSRLSETRRCSKRELVA